MAANPINKNDKAFTVSMLNYFLPKINEFIYHGIFILEIVVLLNHKLIKLKRFIQKI